MEEIWKPIYGSKYYEVSNLGRVRILENTRMRSDGKPYHVKSRIMKPQRTKCGYDKVILWWDLDRKSHLIHRLVMEMFSPVDGMSDLQVNHIDGIKYHNSLDNLEWVTRSDNMQHAMKSGLWVPMYARKDENPHTKLREKEIAEIRALLAEGKYRQYEIAEMYGVRESVISTIKNKRRRFAHE